MFGTTPPQTVASRVDRAGRRAPTRAGHGPAITTGTVRPVGVADRIARASASLTPAERRVAEVVLARPQLVGFGTVAELAEQSDAGAATVVRLAGKLGFEGFTGLQDAIQVELAHQLRPAAERIREPAASDAIGRHMEWESANVGQTLGAVDDLSLAAIVDRLATSRQVLVVSGDASCGVAMQCTIDLAALRDGVTLLAGNEVAVHRVIGQSSPVDAVVAVDLRRYDRWVIAATAAARERGAWVLAITDSHLSPLAGLADRTMTVSAAGGGPFDSHVGTLALVNLLVAGTADRLRAEAAERLARAEAAWRAVGALRDE